MRGLRLHGLGGCSPVHHRPVTLWWQAVGCRLIGRPFNHQGLSATVLLLMRRLSDTHSVVPPQHRLGEAVMQSRGCGQVACLGKISFVCRWTRCALAGPFQAMMAGLPRLVRSEEPHSDPEFEAHTTSTG